MARLRDAVMVVALGTGVMGCAFSQSQSHVAHYSIWHCDECDNFPTPAYGPNFSMMPGSYTSPPAQDSLDSKRPATAFGAGTANSGSVPQPQQMPTSTPAPATITPPTPPAALPGQGVDTRQPTAGSLDVPSTAATQTQSTLPEPKAAAAGNDPHVPVVNPGVGSLLP